VPAEVQVGRSDGWLLNDRIRLIDLLRKGPAPAGLFYGSSSWVLDWIGVAGVSEAISMESLGAGDREHPGGAPHRTAGSTRARGGSQAASLRAPRASSSAGGTAHRRGCAHAGRLASPVSWSGLGGAVAACMAARSASVCTAACISSLATCA